ncbi:MAG: protein-L-isoaspartate(D-aspartate) O-methyltransferase [Planctomycetaceae bacterium]
MVIRSLLFVLVALNLCQGQDKYKSQREEMVRESVEAEGIKNPLVLQAMRSVLRHEFVLPKNRREAYVDKAIAIGHKQTISPPFIVAYMTESLDPEPTDRVLEIGTGSGYQAAVLAEICKEVFSIEIVSPLSKDATKRLKNLGYSNVKTKNGDGYKGWQEHAPFDKIIVTCSPESVPQPLIDQLKEGGRLVVPLGERYQQTFFLFRKVNGNLEQERLIPTLFVPMTGRSEELRRQQPDPMAPRIVNGDFEFDSNDDGKPDAWHYARQCELVEDSPQKGSKCLRMTNSEFGRPSQVLQGIAISGTNIAGLSIAAWIRAKDVRSGPRKIDQSAIVVHFYDKIRREVGHVYIGPFRGTDNWRRYTKTIPVPRQAREMIVRIGLNGATGQLDCDDFEMKYIKR